MLRLKCCLFLISALSPAGAVADTISQTVAFDYDVNFGVSFPVIEGFDTEGGTRELTGVTFAFDHNFDLDLYLESTGPTAVSAGDFSLDLAYLTLFQLGPAEANPPLLGPGALFVDDITGALSAYDGVPGNDGPDSFRRSYDDAFTLVQVYGQQDADVLNALTHVGPLTTVFGGFTELFFQWNNDPGWPFPPSGVPEYPTDAAIWVSWSNFRHFGEIEVTYEYAPVPEPTSALLLAALSALGLRRR